MKITYSKIYDIAILIYMCAVFAHTSLLRTDKLIVLTAIGFLVVATLLKNVVRKAKLDIMFLWYVIFLIFAIGSSVWAVYSRQAVFHYFSHMVQIVIVIFCINSNNDNFEVEKLIKYYLIASVYTILRVLVGTPISQLTVVRFGESIIGMSANLIGLQMAIAGIFSLYYIEVSKKKIGSILLLALFAIVVLLSGSKKALLILACGAVLFALFGTKSQKMHKIMGRVIIIGVIGYIGIYMIFNNPYLYNILGHRLERFIGSATGSYNANDISFNERVYFIEVAKGLFKRYPILGCGLHNFSAYIGTLRYSHIAYSHNNYWEMLSCLGIVGTVIYYSFHLYVIVKLLKMVKEKREPLTVMITIVMILLTAFNYTLITYQMAMYMLIISILYCYTKTGRGNVKNENC